MRTLAIGFQADEKDVRRAFAQLTGNVLTDEQLEDFFTNPVEMPISEVMDPPQAGQMLLAFTALIAGKKGYE